MNHHNLIRGQNPIRDERALNKLLMQEITERKREKSRS